MHPYDIPLRRHRRQRTARHRCGRAVDPSRLSREGARREGLDDRCAGDMRASLTTASCRCYGDARPNPHAAVCHPPIHPYTLGRIIIYCRSWSSHRYGGRLVRAGAMMGLTQLSLFPYAGELVKACRSVHGAPSREVMNGLRRSTAMPREAKQCTPSGRGSHEAGRRGRRTRHNVGGFQRTPYRVRGALRTGAHAATTGTVRATGGRDGETDRAGEDTRDGLYHAAPRRRRTAGSPTSAPASVCGQTGSVGFCRARRGASSPAPRPVQRTRPRRRDRPTGCDTGWTDAGVAVEEKGQQHEGADASAAG